MMILIEKDFLQFCGKLLKILIEFVMLILNATLTPIICFVSLPECVDDFA